VAGQGRNQVSGSSRDKDDLAALAAHAKDTVAMLLA
jgi:hypothetical protein